MYINRQQRILLKVESEQNSKATVSLSGYFDTLNSLPAPRQPKEKNEKISLAPVKPEKKSQNHEKPCSESIEEKKVTTLNRGQIVNFTIEDTLYFNYNVETGESCPELSDVLLLLNIS